MKKLNKKHIFLTLTLYGLIIIIMSFSLSYFQMKENIQKDFLIDSESQLLHDKSILYSWLNHYKEELKVLSTSHIVNDFIMEKPQSKSLMVNYLYDKTRAHKDIMQFRFIDNSGQEIIRIDRKALHDKVKIIKGNALQNKKDRYYFKAISKLAQNQVWVSDIDLNIEYGEVVEPFTPTLRIAIPAFKGNQRRGMFIINIFMKDLLYELELTHHYKLYLIDDQGNFIVHPNKAYNFSKYFDKEAKLSKFFPAQAKKILTIPNYLSEGLFTQEIFLNQDKRYILIAQLNTQTLNEKNYQLIKKFLLIALIIFFLSFPLTYVMVRYINTLYTRLKNILNNLGDGVLVLNDLDNIIYSNKKAHDILEYKSHELDNLKLQSKISHHDSRGNFILNGESPISSVKQTNEEMFSDTETFITKSGRQIDVELNVTPLINKKSYEGSIVVFKDITLKKMLENDLVDMTKNLRMERNLFIEGPVVAFTWTNTDSWPVEYVSSNVVDIFGYTQSEFKSERITYRDCIHPDDLNDVSRQVYNALEAKVDNFMHKPYRIIHKDGSIRWVYDQTVLVKDALNHVTHFHGFVIDVTQQQILQERLFSSEEKYRHLVENSIMGIFQCTTSFEIFYSNHALLKILEIDDLETLYQTDVRQFFFNHKERKAFLRSLNNSSTINNYELSIKTQHGTIKHLLLSAQLDGDNISGTIVDMTLVIQAQDEIQKLSKVIDQIDDLVTITDIQGTIIYVNEAFLKFTGYNREEVIGHSSRIYKSNQHSPEEIKELWDTILDKKVYRAVMINKKKDGSLFHEEKTITPMIDENDNITAFVSTGKDITERIHMQEELKELASTDYLTKLYNRLKFEELFDDELERYRRHKRPLTLIMFDIDWFKKINDTYGHDIGDEVLKELAQLVQHEIRSMDKVARWGGEEFMILVPETNLKSATSLAEKLRKKIANFTFNQVGQVTCSFGVTELKEGEKFSTVSQRADEALYKAKDSGRNRVETI